MPSELTGTPRLFIVRMCTVRAVSAVQRSAAAQSSAGTQPSDGDVWVTGYSSEAKLPRDPETPAGTFESIAGGGGG